MEPSGWDMYTYILESDEAVKNIVSKQDSVFEAALNYCQDKQINQIYLLGSGTSYHASLSAKKLVEDVLKVNVITMYPMEFIDNETVFEDKTLVIGTSQAGRSTSTILALDKAKARGLSTIAITAEHECPLIEHADTSIFLEIDKEYAGPKTKGFIASIATIQLFAMKLARQLDRITAEQKAEIEARLLKTTANISQIAQQSWDWYKANKEDLLKSRRLILVGYDATLGAVMEGTLKILEACRYSVVGYELEEFMHGVYHSIDSDTYLLYLGMPGKHFSRLCNTIKYFDTERQAHDYLITSEAAPAFKNSFIFDFCNDPYFATMEYVVPCQVLARKMSLDLGINCNISSDPNFHEKMGSYTY